jgi:hypothetical protein
MKWLIISLCLWSTFLHACPDSSEVRLLKHLAQEQLWIERIELIDQHRADTCERWQLERAWTENQRKHFGSCDSILNHISFPSAVQNGFGNFYRLHLFRTRALTALQADSLLDEDARYCLNILQERKPILNEAARFDRLNALYAEYSKVKSKSVFLAGLFSIIPGGGKLYCGYRKQAVMNWIVQGGMGIILTEIIIEKGTDNGFFYSAAAVAGTFWLGSIYGTMRSLKKEKKDRLDALYLEITDRFMAAYGHYPF